MLALVVVRKYRDDPQVMTRRNAMNKALVATRYVIFIFYSALNP